MNGFALHNLPVAVIGAGPVGLAAAGRVEHGLTPLLFERGTSVAASLMDWGHVRVFSPWSYNIDAAARALLEAEGWAAPDPEALPTGAEIVRDYLRPIAVHPLVAPHVVLRARVLAVGSKSYMRAPTFLMATGYEQVRSVVAGVAGDHAAACDIRLVLPETGVCNTRSPALAGAGCCGGPAAAGAGAYYLADADAKAARNAGCGCTEAGSRPAEPEPAA